MSGSTTSRRRPSGVTAPLAQLRLAVLAAVLLASSGCGGSGTGSSDDSLSDAVSGTRARYQILDLATGQVSASGAIADLATNPLYRSTRLVFRLVEVGSGQVGSPSSAPGAVLDPPATSASSAPFYLAVFETTQAQWQVLAGSTPWTSLLSADGSDDVRVGDQYPAVGISHDLATAAVAAYRGSRGVTLGLPGDSQWEFACRGGGGGTWAWGEDTSSATVAAAAVVWETAGSTRGARTVGQRAASALGFFDLHGNVWELTREEHLRGGSWNDPLATARAAHRPVIDPATRHLLAGVRLVYTP
jgi:formylglycine-generating enzyme required for sulfatase activity